MTREPMSERTCLRIAACLLLAGQLLYIVITLFHADGEANNHPAVFAEYARNGLWTAVHLGQFVSMAILLAGLLALFLALDIRARAVRLTGWLGAAAAVAALALYGVLQAVDGVALKQAVNAWASAAEAEKAARFAGAEAIRWIEWGVRSYQDYALGLALLLAAAALVRTAWVPRPLTYLVILAGVTYLVQGWVVGTEGFSETETMAIVAAYALDLMWMIWLAVLTWQMQDSELPWPTASESRSP